jgi:hypothetical protein
MKIEILNRWSDAVIYTHEAEGATMRDAALSRALEVAHPVLSKIRHYRLPVGASMLIRMHEASGLSIRELRDLMGDRRTKYRLSDVQGRPKAAAEVRELAAA